MTTPKDNISGVKKSSLESLGSPSSFANLKILESSAASKDVKNQVIKEKKNNPPLPWLTTFGESPNEKNSPSDFVIRILLNDFKAQTKAKLEEITSFNIEEKYLLFDVFESDPRMHQLINSMAELSKYHLSVIIDDLLAWRVSQSVSTDSTSLREKTDKKSKDSAILEERNRLAIEFIFCKIVLLLLENMTKDNLEERLCGELETLAFKYLKPPESRKPEGSDVDDSAVLKAHRKKIPILYSKILGALSQYRFKDIAHRYVKEIIANPVRSKKAIYVIQGIRFLQLQMGNTEGVENSVWFLSKLHLLFKTAQRTEVKQVLADLFVKFLRPYAHYWIKVQGGSSSQLNHPQPAQLPGTRPQVDLAPWFDFMKITFESFTLKKLKTKELMATLPLMTVLLSASKAFDFNDKFFSFMEKLLHVLKDAKLRPVALECILYLLESYLVAANDPDVTKYLTELSSVIFGNITAVKRQTNQQVIGDSFEVFVDIICIIAQYRLNFAMENILFDLLKGENFQIESVTVAIRTIERLFVNSTPYLNKDIGTSSSRTSLTQDSLIEYIPKLSQSISTVLNNLDQSLGNFLLIHTKPINEIIKTDKDLLSVELLRTILGCLPKIIPNKISLSKLVNMLSRYLIHIDRGISDRATSALSRLMKERAEFRPTIVYGLSEFILTIPHNRYDLIFTLLFKMGQLLKQWVENLKLGELKSEVPQDILEVLPTLPVEKIEGFALIFLCCPRAKLRLLGLDILRYVRIVTEDAKPSSLKDILNAKKEPQLSQIPSIRVMAIIDETGTDVVKALQQEIHFLRPVRPTAISVERIAARESREDQLVWTYCLSGIVKYILELCPDVAQHSWSLITPRIHHVQPEDGDRNLTADEQEEMMFWWRNYIVVSCAFVSHGDQSTDTKKKDSNTPSNARDLFLKIIPFLKSSFESHREAAIMALQRANYNVYDVLFDKLRPYAKEFEEDKKIQKKSKAKRDRFRYEMILVYCQIAENMKPGTLATSQNLKQHYSSFIQETCSYLTPNINPFGHLPLRYYFCVLVKHFAQDLYYGGEPMDNTLRKDLFHLIAKWVNVDAMLQDDATKKRLNNALGPIKDLEKKQAYVNLLKEHGVQLQLAGFQAIEALLAGPHFEQIGPNYELFNWISIFLRSDDEVIRRMARFVLESFLSSIFSKSNILGTTLHQCYSPDWDLSSAYFLCLVELFTEEKIQCSDVVLLFLVIYKMGDRDYTVRKRAQDLLLMLKSFVKQEDKWQKIFAIDSAVDETNERAQFNLSSRLAREHPSLAPAFMEELGLRLEFTDERGRRQLLTCSIPWVENIDLGSMNIDLQDATVINFVLLTLKFGADHQSQVEQIWSTLAKKNESNVIIMINKLLDIGFAKRNFSFIDLATSIVVYLGRTCPKLTVDTLVSEMSKLYRTESIPAIHIKSLSNTSNSSHDAKAFTSPHEFLINTPVELKQMNNESSNAESVQGFKVNKTKSEGSKDSSTTPNEKENPDLLKREDSKTKLYLSDGNHELTKRPSKSKLTMTPPKYKDSNPRSLKRQTSISDSSGGRKKSSIKEEESFSASSDVIEIDGSESSTKGVYKSTSSMSLLSNTTSTTIAAPVNADIEEPKIRTLSMIMPDNTDPNVAKWGLSRGHLSQIILAQLTYEVYEECKKHLPVIFQLAILGLDYPQPLVYENCRVILLNMVHQLIVTQLENQTVQKTQEQKNIYEEASYLVQFLLAKAGQQLWTNEEITMKKTEIRSTQELTDLIQVMSVIFATDKEMLENWASQALTWALGGLSMHIRGRSYQIYRALCPSLTREAMNELLESLLKSISEIKRSENRTLALEILYTLQSIVRHMDPQKLILFPQVFWSAIALLHIDYEQHYLNASKLLSQLLDKLNFNDKYVQNVFIASIPKNWDPPFKGLEFLVLKGLFSSITEAKSIQLLTKITTLPCDTIFNAEPGRAIINMVSLLPWLLTSVQNGNFNDYSKSALNIAQACMSQGHNDLAESFRSLSKHKPNEAGDIFLADLRKTLPKVISPDHYCYFTFNFLFAMLNEGVEKYHRAILQLLQLLLQDRSIVVRLSTLSPQTMVVASIPSSQPISQSATPLPPMIQWVVQLCKQLQSTHWELVLPILSKYIATESTSLEIASNLRNSVKTIGSGTNFVLELNQFSNKPGRGVSQTVLSLDKVLSTESRKRNLNFEKSALSFINSSDEGDDEEKKDGDSDSSVEDDQVEFLLNEKPPEKEDIDAFTKAPFGRFPTFRGFDDLLAKLDSIPPETKEGKEGKEGKERDKDKDKEHREKDKDKEREKDKDKEREKDKDKEREKDKDKEREKDKEIRMTTSSPIAITPHKITSSPSGSPAKPKGAFLRSSPKSSSKYPSGGSDFSDSSSGSSPSGTLRLRQLSVAFDNKLVKTTKKWRRLAGQKEYVRSAEMFNIFVVENQLMEYLHEDYKSMYQHIVRSFKTTVKTNFSSPQIKCDSPEFTSLFKSIPEVMFGLVATKYSQRAKSDSSFVQTFTEQRAKLIQDFSQHQVSYTEARVRVDETKQQLTEAPDAKKLEHSERQLATALCQLHLQLLQSCRIHVQFQQLINELLQQDAGADYENKQKVINEETKKNKEVSERLNTENGPPPNVTSSKQSSQKADSKSSPSSQGQKPPIASKNK